MGLEKKVLSEEGLWEGNMGGVEVRRWGHSVMAWRRSPGEGHGCKSVEHSGCVWRLHVLCWKVEVVGVLGYAGS